MSRSLTQAVFPTDHDYSCANFNHTFSPSLARRSAPDSIISPSNNVPRSERPSSARAAYQPPRPQPSIVPELGIAECSASSAAAPCLLAPILDSHNGRLCKQAPRARSARQWPEPAFEQHAQHNSLDDYATAPQHRSNDVYDVAAILGHVATGDLTRDFQCLSAAHLQPRRGEADFG